MPVFLEESSTYDPYDVYLNQSVGDHFLYNQFHDKLKNLPEKLEDFIFDTVPGDFIKDRISIPLGLNENQSRETALIVMDLILTDLYLGNIVSEVQSHLNIDEQRAKTIAGLIVTELFAPILDELKKIHIEKFLKTTGDDRIVDLKNNL